MKIFLLEDNKRLNTTIMNRLEARGYKVISFVDGRQALGAISKDYSCFILDINVPFVSGLEILKKIREIHVKTPVIIISSTIELESIKDSYNFGCDDYIKKPFFIDELEIKIEKLSNFEQNEIRVDEEFYYDKQSGVLRFEDHKSRFSKKEKQMFDLLLEQRGKVVTYEKIEKECSSEEGINISALRTLLRRMRRKLPDDCIETVVDVGYMFKR